uniref:Uncharacterized protein n=1 Tax=Oryza glaberrima TaxID=4538 RepID=I1QF25_ORYGL
MEALACRDGMFNLPAERNSCLSEADDRLGEWHSVPACIEHLVTEGCNSAVS